MEKISFSCFAAIVSLLFTDSLTLGAVVGQVSTFEFDSTINIAIGTHGIGVPVSGSIVYGSDVNDTDPNPRLGFYPVVIENFSVSVGAEQHMGGPVPGTVRIKDNAGCDCFFIDVPFDDEVGGVFVGSIFVNIQNEFGPEAFTMFDNDSLPLYMDSTPDSTWQVFYFRDSSKSIIGRAEIDRISLTTVPEPSTLTFAALALFSLLAHGHRRRRA